IPRFSWERRIGRTDSMFGIGRAMFRQVTARKVCRAARSRTYFSHVSKRQAIWSESQARRWLTRIWLLFSEVAPAFRKLARSADFSRLLLNASSGATAKEIQKGMVVECACFLNGLSLKPLHASSNFKTPLVGSSFAGCRCNHLRNNRVHSSGDG